MADTHTEGSRPFGMDEDDEDFEIPIIPVVEAGPPPECPFCGDPMKFNDGDWVCSDCNGELVGPETG
ncbi:hypothetical protein [Candidatus Nitrospira salsa]|nr:MAG: hypothetical protein NPIRA01_23080 [Nitrospirales bacterium]